MRAKQFRMYLKTALWECRLSKISARSVSPAFWARRQGHDTYDMGDSWEHWIVLEKHLPIDPGTAYPVCTGGGHSTPLPERDRRERIPQVPHINGFAVFHQFSRSARRGSFQASSATTKAGSKYYRCCYRFL